MEGQINFNDYFKSPQAEKPKSLVDFINSMGVSQYNQIGNVISKTCEYHKYNMPDDSIGRITNDVSVWLLGIGSKYEKYLIEQFNIK